MKEKISKMFKDKKTKEKILKILKEVYPYVIIILVVVLIRSFIITPVTVDQISMNDTLYKGDVLLLKKYDKSYDRFDVVVIKHAKDRWIKRIIGLPGEKISCYNGSVYINDEKLEETHVKGQTKGCKDIQLKGDEYFVMGDNREHSQDSRVIGPVNKNDIVGITDFRIFPFNKFGSFDE